MPTISVKNGIMASDSINIVNGYIDSYPLERIFRLQVKTYSDEDENPSLESLDSIYIGVVGTPDSCSAFVAWYVSGARPDQYKFYFEEESSVSAIVFNKTRNEYRRFNNSPIGQPCGSETAIGTGASYALGAMKFGAEAVEAILTVAELDLLTNKKVHYVDMNEGSVNLSYVN